MVAHKPTDEQQKAIDGFRSGENMVIEAAAGTGKTSTLRYIADVDPNKRGLYIAFNKAIQMDAKRRFEGTNVAARTAHSLAYAQFGRPMEHKLARGNRMRAADRADALGLKSAIMAQAKGNDFGVKVARHVVTRIITDTVTAFCRTAQHEITADLVPVPPALMMNEGEDGDFRDQIVKYAKRYWADALNVDGVLPYTHDFYMKSWAISEPRLETDYILFDEAQDADPLVSSIIGAQTHAQIVAVGDRSQAIYGWRGATDSMDRFGGHQYQLTQSFRFGHAIAEEANVWLDILDANLRVRGSDKPSSVHESQNRVPEAVLCRTNAGAIGEVIFSHRLGVPVAISGKGRAKQMRDLAEAAQTLQKQGWTRHPDLDMFTSWEAVQEFVEEDEGADLAPLVKLVDLHTPARLIAAIDRCVPEDQARTAISTVHVAKGLEWTHVRISDDFKVPGKDDEGNLEEVEPAEAMLAYVAVTRAIRHLDNAGLSWVRDYRKAIRRPELGLEWRRRFFDDRREAKELASV
jgi:superfamily I DNA/RNA helicase